MGRLFVRLFPVLAFLLLGFVPPLQAQNISTLKPEMQLVGGYIELTGNGFGPNQGGSEVLFTNGSTTWSGGRAYIWRDDFIRIAVPVGKTESGAALPIDKGPLEAFVQTSMGVSNSHEFRVITANGAGLQFRQLTEISGGHDISSVLGAPNENDARTKDAEASDVNGDGWIDITDANSNNVQNGTHSILRLNSRDKTFIAVRLEPLEDGESGTFATEIPSDGDFFEDHTSYDADFADINNDRLPDYLQTAARNAGGTSDHRIRLLINNRDGVPGQFSEETDARMPGAAFGGTGCPDDIDHVDMDDDGDVDFVVSLRTATGFCPGGTSEVRVFENTGNGFFATPIVLPASADNSTHDVLWFDANHDGLYDIFVANEWNNDDGNANDVTSQLYLNNGMGGFTENRTFDLASTSASIGDFNGDGLMDFVAGRTEVRAYLTNPDSPCLTNPGAACSYTEVEVQAAGGNNPFYDLEVGDVNADGFPDIVGARILSIAENVPIYINDGSGNFTEITGGDSSTVLPGHDGEFQRLSADLFDLDRDGDLDLYLTGQDGEGDNFGDGANQLYENLLFGLNIASPTAEDPAYAGSATGGRKVLVRLRADIPVAGLGPDDFSITVDGDTLAADATITGAQIEEEYWLLVQMPARPDGCYPLEVALISDADMRDLKSNALCYDEERLFDRALAVDRTTSMLHNSVTDTPDPEKLEAAKAASNFFINLSEDDDRIAVTSFNRNADDGDGVAQQNEMARTDWEMTEGFDTTTSTDNRPLAIDAVEVLFPDGTYFPYQTAIGAGLLQAWNELQDEGAADHDWEIVLLSDGIENLAPFWKDVDAGPPLIQPIRPELLAADPDVTVHTVAVGEDADAPLLMDIATATGGQFFNLYEGTGSFGLISRLSSVYKYIDEQIRHEQRFFYLEGVPEPRPFPFSTNVATTHVPRPVRVMSFYVPTDFESITVGFHWNVDHAISTVHLFDPDLVEITPAPPVRVVQVNPNHKLYRIRDPKPGWHHYVVAPKHKDGYEFYAVASGISTVEARGRMGTVRETTPGHYEVPVRLIAGDFAPISTASVNGEVVLPDKSRVPITLYDNGSHEDGLNADGIYGRVFAHTMPGPYSVFLTTTGVSNRAEPFARHTILSFNFPGRDPDPTQPEPPVRDPGDKPGGGDGDAGGGRPEGGCPACAGDAAAYLIGSFDLKEARRSLVEVINPTERTLSYLAAFFDPDGAPLICDRGKVPANGLRHLDLRELKVSEPAGVVKIVAFDPRTEKPFVGLVGNQRRHGPDGIEITGLHPISLEILRRDFKRILSACN